jgi:hypothetical protein
MIFKASATDSSIQDRLRCALLKFIQSAHLREHIVQNKAVHFESLTETQQNAQFDFYREEKDFQEELLDHVAISISASRPRQGDGKVLFSITIAAHLVNQTRDFINIKDSSSELEVQWRADPASSEMKAMRNWRSVVDILRDVVVQWFLPNGEHDKR